MSDEVPAERPQKIELYRSKTLLVRQVLAANSQNWVITFDHHSIGEGLDRFGFGEEFLLANGISAIHVLGCGNDWYQYNDIFDAMAVVREATASAKRKITYGSSMGGYAALRLADAVAADGVLALSPQWSIDPSRAPWEDRWPQDAQRVQWIDTINGDFLCRTCPVLVFDPHVALDLRHVTQISAGTPSVLVPVPYSGHPASTFLGEVSLLRPLLEDVLNDRFDPKAMSRAIRERRSASSVYLGALAERQPAARPRTALALARAARVARPDSTLGMLSLARILTRTGNHDEAVSLHREIAVRTERLPLYLISFADALWVAEMKNEAITIAEEVVNGLPEVAHLRNWLSTMLWKYGARAAAIKHQEHAVALTPKHRRYCRKLYLYRIARCGWWLHDLLVLKVKR
ncbi:tetratricopeptide repeat protein [Sphingomonas sp. GC_Shp_3]|uniref:tetratricopeptide repeat protein n=1 Tax=Sphingomonas sp. GC_Shp_3 TaxID=2937383 RepID=UPI00226998C5|nr:tetratricopeptide repeat protein [Sphingomonas sp. GC_Shp_3]